MSQPERPLRIAQLSATFPPYQGGGGNVCFHMSRELAARGHRVEVFTAQADTSAFGEATVDDGAAIVHRWRPLVAIGNAPLIPQIAGRLRGFDVVHFHHPFIFGTEMLAAARLREASAALVVTVHQRLIGAGARRPLFWGYEEVSGRLLLQRADRVCALSDAHARTVSHLRRMARRAPRRLTVVPNGVDVDGFHPGPDDRGVREGFGIPAGAVVAIIVATLDRAHFFKRVDLAIEALAKLSDDRVHLLVAGGGELLAGFRHQAARAGLDGRVHFAGGVGHDRLPALMRASDLLVMPSDLEAFPLVLLEAMASGLPTVSTDLPGVLAAVREGETGLVAPRDDAPALADRIGRLVQLGPEGRRRMGAAGRAECETRYAWPRVVDRLEQVYAEARAERAARTLTATRGVDR